MRVGYGTTTIQAVIDSGHVSGSSAWPGDGWALALATDAPGAPGSLVGPPNTAGQPPTLGLPYTVRHGVAVRWDYYNWTVGPSSEGDYVSINRMWGALPASDMTSLGTQVTTTGCNLACCPLDSTSASGVEIRQQLTVTYRPDDPATSTVDEELLTVTSSGRSTATTFTMSQGFGGAHLFPPGSNMWIGFTAASTSGTVAVAQIVFGEGTSVVATNTCGP